jgi:hypothetical protein
MKPDYRRSGAARLKHEQKSYDLKVDGFGYVYMMGSEKRRRFAARITRC